MEDITKIIGQTLAKMKAEAAPFYEENQDFVSVVSYPKRSHHWGENRFHGNCDGRLFKDLVQRYAARRVADPMMGSGTTRDVIDGLNRHKNLGIHYWGGDLSDGFNLLRQNLPGCFDFVWVHPPLWNIVHYSRHRDDLSIIEDYTAFLACLKICLARCHKALMVGGRLAVLVGDIRRNGVYYPLGRDVMNMAGSIGQLKSIIIKAQHNCRSDHVKYTRLEDVPIKHEYCLVFKKV